MFSSLSPSSEQLLRANAWYVSLADVIDSYFDSLAGKCFTCQQLHSWTFSLETNNFVTLTSAYAVEVQFLSIGNQQLCIINLFNDILVQH